MTFSMNREDAKLTVAVEGHLDTLTSPDLERGLEPALDGVTELVVDLKDLEYISSTGLRVLVGAAQELGEKGGKMTVINPRAEVMEIFTMTGLDAVFGIV